MRKFLPILLVLIVLVTGVYFIIGLFNSKPPSPTITVGNNSVPTAQGSYCWNGLLNAKCVDMISPPGIIKHQGLKPVVVSPESQLEIEFKKEPNQDSLGANIWSSNDNAEEANINENVLTVPKEKGVYVYDVFANWDEGSSSYAFIIEVQ